MNSSTFNSEHAVVSDSSTQRRGKYPVAAAVAIVIVVAIECGASWVRPPVDRDEFFLPDDRPPSLVETVVDAKLNAANQPGPRHDIVILGDSSGLMGVDPRQLGRLVGRSVYNLATISLMGVEGHQLVFERFAETHGLPATVIYHYAPRDLDFSKEDIQGFGYLTRVKEWIDAAKGSPADLNQEAKWFPSTRFRKYSQRLLSLQTARAKFRAQPRGEWGSHDQASARLAQQNGFLAEINQTTWTETQNLDLPLSEYHRESLESLLESLSSAGVQVFVVANPLPQIAKTETTIAGVTKIRHAMETIASRFPAVSILFPEQRFFDDNAFATLNHLRPQDAKSNTEQIAHALVTANEWTIGSGIDPTSAGRGQ